MKIMILASFPAPYRINVFKGLAERYDVDVFYQNLELQNLHFTGTIQRHSEISGILKFLEKKIL